MANVTPETEQAMIKAAAVIAVEYSKKEPGQLSIISMVDYFYLALDEMIRRYTAGQ